jgi:ubiquitin-protein ligase E3 A
MHNRQEFVNLAVDWYLNKSIAAVFEEFKRGFYSVASGSSLVLFNHHELELLVCGLPHLDFAALQQAAVYEGGYSVSHPAIVRFWCILHELTLEQKKRFLSFVTGCDRAPMGGLGKLRMLIQRAVDEGRLPTSHTCFNVLLLPEYASDARMRQMILTAINNAEGFGLQ